MSIKRPIRAVGLFSGGLDSILAVRIMLEQEIAVTALHFRTGFSYAADPSDAERAADMLGVPLEVIDVSGGYLPLVLNPRHGYGSGMNPCVDCRIFLLRRAKDWMEEHGHQFIFTGEVVGQRPKSQMRPTLNTVERESGLRGFLLRPLSARLLKPTVPEQRGWVDRDKLYDISGRGRKAQIALAKQFSITDYPQPSGGCCYLIHEAYSRRLRDFLEHEGAEALTVEVAQTLAVGRHIRLPSGRKVIVGRREAENDYLESCGLPGVLLTTVGCSGPMTLIPGEPTPEEIELAAQITAGYSGGNDQPSVRVRVRDGDEPLSVLTVVPIEREQAQALMV
jgi:tRNA-specific 2-thiouridylase